MREALRGILNKKSIVFKLWLVMMALVLLTLTVLGVIFHEMFRGFYYKEQRDKLLRQGSILASSLAREKHLALIPHDDSFCRTFGPTVDAAILIVNPAGTVNSCLSPVQWPKHGQVKGEAVTQALAGEVTVKEGFEPLFRTEVITVGIPIRNEDKVIGAVMLYAPIPPILRTIKAVQNLNVLGITLGALMAALAAFFISRILSRPLLRMNRFAHKLAAGEYERRLENLSGGDEMGALASSLNFLAERLETNRAKEQQIDRMKRDFVANVSHELRSPLSYLQGYTEAMLDGLVKDPAQQQKYLQLMLDETLRLRNLVNELLDLEELESVGLGEGHEAVDIGLVIREMEDRFAPLAQQRGVRFTLETGALPVIRGHRDRLAQVMINLLDNALRFTPEGGEIRLQTSAANNKITITVSDTGEGIPAEDIPYIFERFYKADKARNRKQGSGLGLAIARNIVRAHGGDISVQSAAGSGTAFTITLPMRPLGING